MKNLQYRYSLGKYESKPQWDITSRVTKMKKKRQIILNSGEDKEKFESSFIVGWIIKCYNHFKKHLTVSKNVKHRVIWPRSSIPSYMSKRNKNICPHKNRYTNVENNISQSPKKYKQHKCLITDEWMNKCAIFPQWNTIQVLKELKYRNML